MTIGPTGSDSSQQAFSKPGAVQFNSRHFAVGRNGTLVHDDPLRLLEAQSADPEIDRVSRHVSNLLNGIDDDAKVSLDDIETLLLKQAVARAQGNVAAAARLLGITRPQMVYRLKTRDILPHGE